MSNCVFYTRRYPEVNKYGGNVFAYLDFNLITNYVDFRMAIYGLCELYECMLNDPEVDVTYIEMEDIIDDLYYNMINRKEKLDE